MQRSALCRSRRELSNAYLLAKIGVDTAENEPCKVCPLSVYRSPRSVVKAMDEADVLRHAVKDIKAKAHNVAFSPGNYFDAARSLDDLKHAVREIKPWLKDSISNLYLIFQSNDQTL